MKPLPFFLAAAVIVAGGCGNSTTRTAHPNTSSSSLPTTEATIGTHISLPCPKYQASTNVGYVRSAQLDELSGLARSSYSSNVVWTHNDSGDAARVYGIKPSGDLISTITLRNTSTFDAEDIAVANGQIWLADIGDNLRIRSSVQLYHFDEPRIAGTKYEEQTVDATKLNVKFQLPDSSETYSVDSEAFFIDRAGNGYLIEKTLDKKNAWIFKLSADDMKSEGTVTAKPILQITGNSNGNGYGPTAADISRDSTTLVIKNYSETFVWRFTPESSIQSLLASTPTGCIVKAGLGEAITFDGTDLLTIEEGVNKPLKRTKQMR